MKTSLVIVTAAIAAAAVLAGCASPNYYGQGNTPPYPYPAASQPSPQAYPQPYPQSYPAVQSSSYGTIDSIRVGQPAGASTGTGAVVGGLVGGLLGNQVGGGHGRTAATIAGVIGGAIVGEQIEQRNAQLRDAYQIGVRLDDGSYRTVTQDSVAGLQVGNRVRIENGHVYRY